MYIMDSDRDLTADEEADIFGEPTDAEYNLSKEDIMRNLKKRIKDLVEELNVEFEKEDAGNKSAGKRARKLTLELGKLFKDYRKESIARAK